MTVKLFLPFFFFLLFLSTKALHAIENESQSEARLGPNCQILQPAIVDTEAEVNPLKVAFVAGNSAYRNAGTLNNPHNDATVVSSLLQKLGFKVYLTIDSESADLNSCAVAAASDSQRADVTLIYFSGHGIQIQDTNFVVGVEAQSTVPEDLAGFVSVEELSRTLANPDGKLLVFLDACRDNAFEGDISQGLAPVGSDRGTGLPQEQFIAYATSPNLIAWEGNGELSFFSKAIVDHLAIPGWPLERVMGAVANAVGEATNWRQTPWRRSSLSEPIFLNGKIDIEEAKSISLQQAAKSKAAIETGSRSDAIKEALAGLPSNWLDANDAVFEPSFRALQTAIASRIYKVSHDSNFRYAISPQFDRALIADFSGSPSRAATLLSLPDGKPQKIIMDRRSLPIEITKLAFDFSPNGEVFAFFNVRGEISIARSSDGTILATRSVINDLKNSSEKLDQTESFGHFGNSFSSLKIRFFGDGRKLVLSSKQRIFVYEIDHTKDLKFEIIGIISLDKHPAKPGTTLFAGHLFELRVLFDPVLSHLLIAVMYSNGREGFVSAYNDALELQWTLPLRPALDTRPTGMDDGGVAQNSFEIDAGNRTLLHITSSSDKGFSNSIMRFIRLDVPGYTNNEVDIGELVSQVDVLENGYVAVTGGVDSTIIMVVNPNNLRAHVSTQDYFLSFHNIHMKNGSQMGYYSDWYRPTIVNTLGENFNETIFLEAQDRYPADGIEYKSIR